MKGQSTTWQQAWGHLRTGLAATAVLALALAGSAGGAAAQSGSPSDVVRAFIDAGNRHDLAAMSALADPAFGLVEDPHQPGRHTENLAELQGHLATVTILSMQQTGANMVTVDANLSGASLPPIHVPFHLTYVVTVTNVKVARKEETIAPETSAALRALGPGPDFTPGMPSTGSSDSIIYALLGLGVAGIAALAGGTVARHRSHSRQ